MNVFDSVSCSETSFLCYIDKKNKIENMFEKSVEKIEKYVILILRVNKLIKIRLANNVFGR